jgi:hypothetical protein
MPEKTIDNGYSYDKNGWKFISIYGKPKERGYAYGYLCADEFKEIQKMLKFVVYDSFGKEWETIVKEVAEDFAEMTKTEFEELYEEMEGITEGCNKNGCETTLEEIIAWNFYMSIPYWYSTKSDNKIAKEGGAKDHCSAFMAVGDWTEDGKIVCTHNSFTDFVSGQYMNVVLDLKPEKGTRFIMQTSPCCIWSGTDFFVTAKGIIGTETTIGGFMPYEKKYPIGYRIRKAMQYAESLDEYCEILLRENSGDYANSWLFGDTNTNEILRIELGLKYHNIERTKNGFFIGFNAPYDDRIRNLECHNTGFYDIRRHQGARLVRLSDLMDEHKGKINVEIAKKIISDHYDVYLLKEDNPCSRTICSHYELDAREYMSQEGRPLPFAPHGAVDGIVCDSELAKNMSFIGRFGNSCGMPFVKDEFFKKHRQYERYEPYIKDRPSQEWTTFTIYDKKGKKEDEDEDEEKKEKKEDEDEEKKEKGKQRGGFRLTKRGKNKNKKTKKIRRK